MTGALVIAVCVAILIGLTLMIDARQRRNARTPPSDGGSFPDTNDSGGYLWSSLGGRLSDLLSGNHSTNHHSGHSGGQGDSGGGVDGASGGGTN